MTTVPVPITARLIAFVKLGRPLFLVGGFVLYRTNGFEEAEGKPDLDPTGGGEVVEPNPYGGREVAEADREADQQQARESAQAAAALIVCSKPAAPAWPATGPRIGSVVPASR